MAESTVAHATPQASAAEVFRPSSHWTAWGQWLALFTMTVDHLTRYVLPGDWDLSWAGSSIGRIAFPLFAAMVAWHGLFNTRNKKRKKKEKEEKKKKQKKDKKKGKREKT